MNHGIKVVRHNEPPLIEIAAEVGVVHLFNAGQTDEEIVAGILCMRLIDDEHDSNWAKACRIVHAWPPFPGIGFGRTLHSPDPQCVIKRTAALQRWKYKDLNTARSDTAQSEPCGRAMPIRHCSG